MASVDLSDVCWRKSSRSSTWSNCVEIAFPDQAVATRDSKRRDGAVLVFSRDDWRSFLSAITADRLSS